MISRRRATVWACRLGVALSLALAAGGALAASPPSARLAWSTYLRSGPGETYQAVDEVEHGVAVTIDRCSDRWCRVSAPGIAGYVDRDALALPSPPSPQPSASACVVAGQADDRRPMPTRFCSAAAPAR